MFHVCMPSHSKCKTSHSSFMNCVIYRRKPKITILSIGVTVLVVYLISQWQFVCDITHIEETYSNPLDAHVCEKATKQARGPSFQGHRYVKPNCPGILTKMVKGKWVERKEANIMGARMELDQLHENFRVYHEGFSKYPFREDGLCGFKHQLGNRACHFITFDASAWCSSTSDKPCCSDIMDGFCMSEDNCTTPNSVNLAKYVHAELSDWVPYDQRCKMSLYNQATACALLHQKNVRSIGFVGNSLIRNIYSAMLQMLTNNFHNGSVPQCIAPSLRKRCVGHWQNIDKYCLGLAMSGSSQGLPGHGICNGYLDTYLYFKEYWLVETAQSLKSHVTELLDKPGTYLLIGIGVHDKFNAELVTEAYLKPTFDLLIDHQWPKILWIHQLKTGIFKPPGYVRMHGTDDDIDAYVERVEEFCRSYSVPTLDLRDVTTGVWSVDGTHYGTGVNLMKIQLFLNFLASGQVF